jgi:outer membrane protein assembly factor BamB
MTRTAIAAMFLALMAGPAAADDWPQWMGPKRDNVWREDGLLDRFPVGGPKVVWRVPVNGGYAGPAVSNGRVYVTDYAAEGTVKADNFQRKTYTGTESVRCLDEATGNTIWQHKYPVKYSISYPSGPRCTPTVHQGKVYTLGAEGNLFCFNADSGAILWSKDLKKDYGTKSALWGYCSHPLIDGQKLISVVGGDGSYTVAFDKDTGKEIWRTLTAAGQGYSPPTFIEAGGGRQLIVMLPDGISGVDPETGKEHWTQPYEATSGSIIMSPLKWHDYLYVGGYSNKNLMLKLATDKPGAETIWRDKKGLGVSPVNVQPFIDGDVMYGFDQSGELMAIELPSGKRLWKSSAPVGPKPEINGTAFLVKQDDRFWMFNELGELVIGKLSPTGYDEIDRAKVIEPTNAAFGRAVVWCMPAFANKRMYVRNDKECICVNLAK